MVVLLSESEIDKLQSMVTLLSSLSLVANLTIVCTHYFYKHLRSRSAKLVLSLTLSVLGSDLTALSFAHGGSCSLYGLFASFFFVAMTLWSGAISRTISIVVRRDELHRSLTRLNSIAEENRFAIKITNIELLRMIAFHCFVYGVAITSAIGITVLSRQNPISGWCWFSDAADSDSSAPVGQLLFFYIPIVSALLYNSLVLGSTYWRHCCSRWREQHDILVADLSQLVLSLHYYVLYAMLIMLIICLAELINITAFPHYSSQEQHFWLYFILSVVIRSQGTFNLLVYARRSDVRKAWYDTLIYTVLKRDRPLEDDECSDDGRYEAPSTGTKSFSTPALAREGVSASVQTPLTVSSFESTPFTPLY